MHYARINPSLKVVKNIFIATKARAFNKLQHELEEFLSENLLLNYGIQMRQLNGIIFILF